MRSAIVTAIFASTLISSAFAQTTSPTPVSSTVTLEETERLHPSWFTEKGTYRPCLLICAHHPDDCACLKGRQIRSSRRRRPTTLLSERIGLPLLDLHSQVAVSQLISGGPS
jgi:hypothetical protein